tara:strand:- start:1299 stop:1580 length:282 start_codon:yes stop_codon:yes gene_type:complete
MTKVYVLVDAIVEFGSNVVRLEKGAERDFTDHVLQHIPGHMISENKPEALKAESTAKKAKKAAVKQEPEKKPEKEPELEKEVKDDLSPPETEV